MSTSLSLLSQNCKGPVCTLLWPNNQLTHNNLEVFNQSRPILCQRALEVHNGKINQPNFKSPQSPGRERRSTIPEDIRTPNENKSKFDDSPKEYAPLLTPVKTRQSDEVVSCTTAADSSNENDREISALQFFSNSYSVLQYKKPKRHFKTKEERLNFIKTYQSKIKTELCKNWEAFRQCKFKDKCSFAHGLHEIRKKSHLPSNYKTKHCKQFQETMFCPYGSRCQFFHYHRIPGKKIGISYTELLKTNEKFIVYMVQHNEKFEDKLKYINHMPRNRLPIFEALAGKQ